MVWTQIIRGTYQSSFQFCEKDMPPKLETRIRSEGAVGYDYTLRPILFVVPRGSPRLPAGSPAQGGRGAACPLPELRRRNRDGARSARRRGARLDSRRTSADLAPALREILEKTEVGKLTPPEVTAQGIEVYALCRKEHTSAENTPDKRKVREELVNQQFQAKSKRFMKELRSQAMIEHR